MCPVRKGLTLQSYCGDGIGTINPLRNREGSGCLGNKQHANIVADKAPTMKPSQKDTRHSNPGVSGATLILREYIVHNCKELLIYF